MRRRHRWRGRWHPECLALDLPHWHVSCRDKNCRQFWMEPVLFDPTPWQVPA